MFTIERSPDYAQAESLLEGCVPLGATTLGRDVLLVGRCGSERRAVRVGRRESAVQAVGLSELTVLCVGVDRLRLRATGSSALDQVVNSPESGLGVLLPERLGPVDSRAVWTGKSLVVASAVGNRLVVRRHTCASRSAE
jgi:hypothetical protein